MNYLKLLQKNIPIVILIMVMVSALALFLNSTRPSQYEGTFNLSVQKVNREVTEEWQFDDFYTLQAVNLVSDTVQSWFNSPAWLKQISLDTRVKFFKRKLSGQNIELRIITPTNEQTKEVVGKTQGLLKSEIENLSQTAEGEPSFSVKFFPVVIVNTKPSNLWVVLAGLVVGLGISLLYLSVKKNNSKIS